MKSVLISIQPKWCELIASGKKTVEVRKTKPKLETPFKVYIYCTKGREPNVLFKWCKSNNFLKAEYTALNGKVIGEFVCDSIDYVRNYGDMVDSYDCIASCLSAKEIIDYAKDKDGNFVYTYGWHISDLVIYDKPRELGEFYIPIKDYWEIYNPSNYINGCWKKPLKRPPQSWCYVESGDT